MPAVEKKSDNIVAFPTKPDAKLEYHPTIHDMPSEERPRERLRNYGARVLSNAELLAIILRTGTTQENVIELAGKLLYKYGGFGGLLRAEFMELCAEYGLGEAKTAQLKAALEIGRRLGVAQNEEKYQIKSPLDAANLVMMEMTFLDHEQMRILVLDTKNQVVENINRYQGTVNSSVLRAAEIYRPAVIRNCPGVIICHNHPSGDPTPSPVIWRKFCQEEEGERTNSPYLPTRSSTWEPALSHQNPTGSQVTPALSALVPRLLPTRRSQPLPQSIKVRRRVLPPPSKRVCALSAWWRWRSPGGE